MSNLLNFSFAESVLSGIESAAPQLETLQTVGLDWSVNKVQLQLPDGTPVEHYANQRADNGKVLGVFTEAYNVFQNESLVELVTSLAGEFGYKVHSGGALNGGRKVYIQLDAGDIRGIGQNEDTIKKYVTAINSFDGSTGVGFGSTGTTISCQNTFYRAYRNKGMQRVRHTETMHDRIDVARRELLGLTEQERSLYDVFFKMAAAEATPAITQALITSLTGLDITKGERSLKVDHSTRSVNIAKELIQSIARESQYKGGSLWGLMSGVTHFTTHKASAPDREGGRTEAKMFGNAGTMDAKAFDFLAELVA